MDLSNYYDRIMKAIRYGGQDPSLELEVVLKNKDINVSTFTTFMAKLKAFVSRDPIIEETLDISFADRDNNMRITIIGKRAIMDYCKNGDITRIPPKHLIVQSKERVTAIDINEYNIRFNSKREKAISQKSAEVLSLFQTLKGLDKIFRYKRRYSFKTPDNLFQYDCTIVKTNTQKEVRGKNTRKMKKEIKDYMKKYLVLPSYVSDVDKWLSEMADTDFVELIGKKYTEYIPKKNIKAAKVFENPMNYEVELEYIGNKLEKAERGSNKEVYQKFVEYTGILLQIIQKNYFIISENEKSEFFDTYKSLVKDFKFSGPQTVDLEYSSCLERNYADYYNTVNIRKNYSVTDKADGERNLLVVCKGGKCYMMNRKNVIKATGVTVSSDFEGTILDGEYITEDKKGKPLSLYMVFDIYFYKKSDLRDRILIRSMEERGTTSSIPKSRFEYLDDLFKLFDPEYIIDSGIKFTIERKKFYFGSSDSFDQNVERGISSMMETLSNISERETDAIAEIKSRISELKDDTSIFAHCDTILKKDYVYDIDGLVFTPINLAVGEEPNIRKRNQYSGRWHRSFKWKPANLITIDFQVEVKKDTDGKPLVSYGMYKGEMVPYQSLVLKVGYDPKQHTRYNSFRVLNEAQVYAERYSPIPFQPVNPYMKDTHILYIPIDGNSIKCKNGMIIKDNDIVECIYNKASEGHFNKWTPLRVRDVLTPNDFMTANNVWKTFHNPISNEMIQSGKIEAQTEEMYYYNVNARKDMSSKSLADYHSFLKKNLIKSVSNVGSSLLDLSCGKLGDLNHWIDAELGICVGLDLNRDNLENVDNGAANRVLNKMTEYSLAGNDIPRLLENTLLIWADTSKNINDSTAGKDILNKYYLDIIKGNVAVDQVKNSKLRKFYGISDGSPQNGFDIVSCQFSIHYFFENETTLRTFLENVSNNLREGGKFIGTCLNGNRVFSLLEGKTLVEKFSEGKLIWKINKAYDAEIEHFPNNSDGLGIPIDVYFESIGNTTREYLVNMDYLISLAAQYNLKLVVNNSFESKYDDLKALKTPYGSAAEMNDVLTEYSFLNDYFIFEKDLKEHE